MRQDRSELVLEKGLPIKRNKLSQEREETEKRKSEGNTVKGQEGDSSYRGPHYAIMFWGATGGGENIISMEEE